MESIKLRSPNGVFLWLSWGAQDPLDHRTQLLVLTTLLARPALADQEQEGMKPSLLARCTILL